MVSRLRMRHWAGAARPVFRVSGCLSGSSRPHSLVCPVPGVLGRCGGAPAGSARASHPMRERGAGPAPKHGHPPCRSASAQKSERSHTRAAFALSERESGSVEAPLRTPPRLSRGSLQIRYLVRVHGNRHVQTLIPKKMLAAGICGCYLLEHEHVEIAQLGFMAVIVTRAVHLDDPQTRVLLVIGAQATIVRASMGERRGKRKRDSTGFVKLRRGRICPGIAIDQGFKLPMLRTSLPHVDLILTQEDQLVEDIASIVLLAHRWDGLYRAILHTVSCAPRS